MSYFSNPYINQPKPSNMYYIVDGKVNPNFMNFGSQTPSNPKVLGASTDSSTAKSSTPSQPSQQENINNLVGQQDSEAQRLRQMEIDTINAEYEAEQNRLNELESGVTQRYGEAKSQMESYFPQFQALTEQQRSTDLGGLQETENVRKTESAGALNKVRSLLADLQRRQQAYMSATGNYSSSTADALGEQFGRQAFSSLSDVQSQRDSALRQIENERAKVNNFYSNKILEGKQKYQDALNNLMLQFNQQRDQIANAKGASQSAKAQATIDAWRNYTNTKMQLSDQAFQYKMQYDRWKQQMDASLAQQAQVGNISTINPNYSDLQGQIAGVGVAPTASVSRTSGYTRAPVNDDLWLQQVMSQQNKV